MRRGRREGARGYRSSSGSSCCGCQRWHVYRQLLRAWWGKCRHGRRFFSNRGCLAGSASSSVRCSPWRGGEPTPVLPEAFACSWCESPVRWGALIAHSSACFHPGAHRVGTFVAEGPSRKLHSPSAVSCAFQLFVSLGAGRGWHCCSATFVRPGRGAHGRAGEGPRRAHPTSCPHRSIAWFCSGSSGRQPPLKCVCHSRYPHSPKRSVR